VELVQELGRRITAVTEDTRETTYLFQRLSVALQRGNAVSFHCTVSVFPVSSGLIVTYGPNYKCSIVRLSYRYQNFNLKLCAGVTQKSNVWFENCFLYNCRPFLFGRHNRNTWCTFMPLLVMEQNHNNLIK